jgi:hypothetical protein
MFGESGERARNLGGSKFVTDFMSTIVRSQRISTDKRASSDQAIAGGKPTYRDLMLRTFICDRLLVSRLVLQRPENNNRQIRSRKNPKLFKRSTP